MASPGRACQNRTTVLFLIIEEVGMIPNGAGGVCRRDDKDREIPIFPTDRSVNSGKSVVADFRAWPIVARQPDDYFQ
jgi:hypothetical protein